MMAIKSFTQKTSVSSDLTPLPLLQVLARIHSIKNWDKESFT